MPPPGASCCTSPCRPPPAAAAAACAALTPGELPDGAILALEKPFGDDEESARELNRVLSALLPEERIFRVDHFLGRSTVLDILGVRFANRVFESIWSANTSSASRSDSTRRSVSRGRRRSTTTRARSTT